MPYDNVKQELKDYKIDSVFIPGGCTKYIQAPDVCWNKPFKGLVTEKYDEWIANGVHEYTKAENMNAAPRRLVVEWILKSWNKLNLDTIKDSFKYCALTLNVDGTEDDIISCFKSDKPCAAGKKVLN